jgi:hypothetical protein
MIAVFLLSAAASWSPGRRAAGMARQIEQHLPDTQGMADTARRNCCVFVPTVFFVRRDGFSRSNEVTESLWSLHLKVQRSGRRETGSKNHAGIDRWRYRGGTGGPPKRAARNPRASASGRQPPAKITSYSLTLVVLFCGGDESFKKQLSD